MSAVAFAGAEVRSSPFLHATVGSVFGDELADELGAELARFDGWRLHRGEFFEQYEANLLGLRDAGAGFASLTPGTLDALRERVATLMATEFEPRVKVIAHRMDPGQGIGLHNDDPQGDDETHRLVINFGETAGDGDGGHLVLFSDATIEAVDRVFRPVHNAGLAFAASSESYHAVTEVRAGVRYTIVCSFWQREPLVAGAREIAHSSGTLADHLEGVRTLLAAWDLPRDVCDAGLLHSAYGADDLGHGPGGDPAARERVSDAIGPAAEQLVWLYAVSARGSIVPAALGEPLVDHRTGETIAATDRQRLALLLIDVADTIEQLPRLPRDADAVAAERARLAPAAHLLPPAAAEALERTVSAITG